MKVFRGNDEYLTTEKIVTLLYEIAKNDAAMNEFHPEEHTCWIAADMIEKLVAMVEKERAKVNANDMALKRLDWTIQDNAKKAIEIADLRARVESLEAKLKLSEATSEHRRLALAATAQGLEFSGVLRESEQFRIRSEHAEATIRRIEALPKYAHAKQVFNAVKSGERVIFENDLTAALQETP